MYLFILLSVSLQALFHRERLCSDWFRTFKYMIDSCLLRISAMEHKEWPA